MPPTPVRSILCVASFFKGNRFLQRCHAEGCSVHLLTVEEMRGKPWAREAITGFHVIPSSERRDVVIAAVTCLMCETPIDAVVALDDFDVELAAALREHFRIPGMGETTVRYFRDKLAMRDMAARHGIRQPAFTPLLPTERVGAFLERVSGPWLLKPRGSASAIGIRKLDAPDQVLQTLEGLGDQRSHHLLEQMVPGDLYHVDSLVAEREVVFAQVARYHRPDTSRFTDPEIVHRVVDPYHVGFVLRSPSPARIEQLLTEYLQRIQRDFLAVLPPAEKATS